jgi:hypothetical protein
VDILRSMPRLYTCLVNQYALLRCADFKRSIWMVIIIGRMKFRLPEATNMSITNYRHYTMALYILSMLNTDVTYVKQSHAVFSLRYQLPVRRNISTPIHCTQSSISCKGHVLSNMEIPSLL